MGTINNHAMFGDNEICFYLGHDKFGMNQAVLQKKSVLISSKDGK